MRQVLGRWPCFWTAAQQLVWVLSMAGQHPANAKFSAIVDRRVECEKCAEEVKRQNELADKSIRLSHEPVRETAYGKTPDNWSQFGVLIFN